MAAIFYEVEESLNEDCGKLQIVEKYVKDYRGMYSRQSMSARLLLEAVRLTPEQEKAILEEANGYKLVAVDEEYGDHDDMGEFRVSSSSTTISLGQVNGILIKDGHFFGLYIEQSALTIDGAVYGKCSYRETPMNDDTDRTTYYRYIEYKLLKRD